MKKILLLASVLCFGLSANAQWVDGEEGELPLYKANRDYPASDMATSAHGTTWFFLNQMGNVGGESTEVYYCQGLDANGKTIMGEEPACLSAYPYQSWTMVNKNIFVDRDGNAIMSVQDKRGLTDYHKASVYKISPTGEQLWGETGICISSGLVNYLLVGFTGCQLSDGSYVFAWMSALDYDDTFEIIMMRLNEDGTFAWEPGEVKLSTPNVPYYYPTVLDAGNGQFNLVYAEGSNQTVKVMKYDFDGTPVWEEAVEVYNGGWGSTPMWTKCAAKPSGDGGVLFTWYDDRDFTNFEDAYLAYVKPNGTLGFNQRNGIKLDYTEFTRDLGVDVVYEPGSDSFVALMLSASESQSYYTLKAQRISKTGDLLWGENAKEVGEMVDGRYGFQSVVCGETGRVAFFYEMSADGLGREVNNYADYYDVKTGERVWDSAVCFGVRNTPKGDLQAGSCGNFWTASWVGHVWIEDPEYPGGGYYSSSIGNVNAQRVNFDGSLGNDPTGIGSVSADGTSNFRINGNSVAFDGEGKVYDISGRLVGEGKSVNLAPGVYMGVEGNKAAKFVIR